MRIFILGDQSTALQIDSEIPEGNNGGRQKNGDDYYILILSLGSKDLKFIHYA
jgi:hypothetical protein